MVECKTCENSHCSGYSGGVLNCANYVQKKPQTNVEVAREWIPVTERLPKRGTGGLTMKFFLDWFVDWVERLTQALLDAARVAAWIALIVLSSPMWLLPFAYWFIFVRKKEEET